MSKAHRRVDRGTAFGCLSEWVIATKGCRLGPIRGPAGVQLSLYTGWKGLGGGHYRLAVEGPMGWFLKFW